MNQELLIYGVHGLCWGAFGLARWWCARGAAPADRARPADSARSAAVPVAKEQQTGPGSRTVLGLHMVAFFLLYFGMGDAVFGHRVPEVFQGQRAVGTVLMLLGSAAMTWALLSFRSWRFRAQVEKGHELATGGPFKWVRHPIYLGLNLLMLGTSVWIPTPPVIAGFVLGAICGDLRGRAEEKLLLQVFGATYRDYMGRTHRFLPGIY
ncbi:MAG TPA: isoprenylcysteine carboxylmethyltransferase family protein [Bdellovibrionota bacterium]|nr:isoprenylcysteine carboxylmethyltransferase family protein [Bdellovibrionota bacterium]